MEYLNCINNFVTGGVPSYAQTFHDIKLGVDYFSKNCTTDSGGLHLPDFSPTLFFDNLKKYGTFDNAQEDITAIACLAVLWTIIRYVLTLFIFKPVAEWFLLSPLNASKYPESAWKLLVYTFTWTLSCYTIFGLPHNTHIYYEPDTLWKDLRQGMEVEPMVYYVYMIQLSFYVHSIYATCCMDAWRKDSALMIFHHFLTIALIGFSYISRYHKIGLLVVFLHDPSDIALEFTKCNVYFKKRGGNYYRLNDALSTVGFIVFAAFWYHFRLYWLPLKVLHSAGYGTMLCHQERGHLPFYFFFNGLLWVLQILHCYWFLFIINFLIKVATGQINEVDDIREEEVYIKMVEDQKRTKYVNRIMC